MASSRTTKTYRVFIDSTVLFAAAYSKTGSARDLLREGLRGSVELYISDDVLEESERNLTIKAPQALGQFAVFREALAPSRVDPTRALVGQAAEVVAAKDAPIVAAAAAAQAAYLATYDRKHLLSRKKVVEDRFGVVVATPEEVLAAIR